MNDTPHSNTKQPPAGGKLRDRFPGYFAPGDEALGEFFTKGVVVFGTNTVLSAYRLKGTAREEFLNAMRLLGDRLWVPHQVSKEFMQNRPEVIRECASVADALSDALAEPFTAISRIIRQFGNRRGLTGDEIAHLEKILTEARSQLVSQAVAFYGFDTTLTGDTAPDEDPIYLAVEEILDGKIGQPCKNPLNVRKQGVQRIAARIPPGYADYKKDDDDKAIGDYVLWWQTLEKAKAQQAPVLLVTNDAKEDWVHTDGKGDQKKVLGPRSELVLEMEREAGQSFHLVNVPSFLQYAKIYLAAQVSAATMEQAQHVVAQSASGWSRCGPSSKRSSPV